MNVTVNIPEAIFERSRREIADELLKEAAVEAFRAGAISLGRLAEILDVTIDEAHKVLKDHDVTSLMTAVDLDEGREVLNSLLRR